MNSLSILINASWTYLYICYSTTLEEQLVEKNVTNLRKTNVAVVITLKTSEKMSAWGKDITNQEMGAQKNKDTPNRWWHQGSATKGKCKIKNDRSTVHHKQRQQLNIIDRYIWRCWNAKNCHMGKKTTGTRALHFQRATVISMPEAFAHSCLLPKWGDHLQILFQDPFIKRVQKRTKITESLIQFIVAITVIKPYTQVLGLFEPPRVTRLWKLPLKKQAL